MDARARLRADYLDAERMGDGERFDTIVAGELIEHLTNPGLFLNGCRNRLKPRGRLVLSTPNAFGVMFQMIYLKNAGRSFNPEHTCWFDRRTLTQILERQRFGVMELRFLDDLRDSGDDPGYNAFVRGWRAIRRVLPVRYRNTLVAVEPKIATQPVLPLPTSRTGWCRCRRRFGCTANRLEPSRSPPAIRTVR